MGGGYKKGIKMKKRFIRIKSTGQFRDNKKQKTVGDLASMLNTIFDMLSEIEIRLTKLESKIEQEEQ